MRVTFILSNPGISGGVKAVYEFANHLHARGHEVRIIYPLIPLRFWSGWRNPYKIARQIIGTILKLLRGITVDWFDLKATLKMVPTFAEIFIPDGDAIFATWWETANIVNKYSLKKGKKFYLIQHYEIWEGNEEEVNATFKLGLKNIVNSSWLKEILQNLGAPVEALILHAPDWTEYFTERQENNTGNLRILMPYRVDEWKGTEDGIKAFEIVKQKHPDVQLVMFGLVKGKSLPEGIPQDTELYRRPYGSTLRKIYNSCDIFVFPSRSEGFGMPPMEAMACKCAVVTTDVGAVPEYTIPGETALVSPPQAPEKLAENIIKLIDDRDLLKRISEAGYNYVRNFTWDKATAYLEYVLLNNISR